jgi:SAM-dependent methyltransferase
VPEPNVSALPEGEMSRRSLVARIRQQSRLRRSEMFRRCFSLAKDTRVLDLGGWDGSHLHSVLSGTAVDPKNVWIADISEKAIRSASERFGYNPKLLGESERLPFGDKAFDVVFCSSVLEHVTVPKAEVWSLRSGREFRRRSLARQQEFAAEISRIGNGYFVQVPYRWFPVETHTWLPFAGYLPRRLQVPLIATSNRVWIKGTQPDFYLPTRSEMLSLFPNCRLELERSLGFVKSIIAVRSAE